MRTTYLYERYQHEVRTEYSNVPYVSGVHQQKKGTGTININSRDRDRREREKKKKNLIVMDAIIWRLKRCCSVIGSGGGGMGYGIGRDGDDGGAGDVLRKKEGSYSGSRRGHSVQNRIPGARDTRRC